MLNSQEPQDIRAQVAEETGVPASALRGTTREELHEHAEQIKALVLDTPGPRPGAVPGEGQTIGSGTASGASLFAELMRQSRGY
jgi:hypothetical protein